MPFLEWLHNNPAIAWVHESDSLFGYTLYLSFHTIGMVFLVGPTLVIAARVLGLAPDLPIAPLRAFRPVIAAGLWITIVTGSVLFATAAPDYVTNVVFVVKIVALVIALVCMRGMLRALFDGPEEITPRAKAFTIGMLLMWVVGVVAGRLTAYSGIVVVAAITAFLVLLAVVAAGAFLGRVLTRRGHPHAAFAVPPRPTVVKGGK